AALDLFQRVVSAKDGSIIAVKEVVDYAAAHPNDARMQLFAARTLQAAGRLDMARMFFTAAKKPDPGFREVDMPMARLDIAQHNYPAARATLQKVLAADSASIDALVNLAYLDGLEGKSSTAIDSYRK